jgi:peptidylprolyl isomerase
MSRSSSLALLAIPTLAATLALGACGRDEPRFRAPDERDRGDHGDTPERDSRAGAAAGSAGDRAAADPHAGLGIPPAGGIPAPEDVAAAPGDAQRTPSGLASKVIRPGTGSARPGPRDRVTVHYTGWTTDGRMFDSSVTRGEPATFGLDGVIPGWTEGLQLMVAGERRRFWIPGSLAYEGRPGPQGTLVFDVELISFVAAPEPPAVPEDVAAAPRTAQTTASGLASRVLRPGTGSRHPTETNTVEVHYTGWTTDGEMFDSSVTRGETATFPLNRVIPGWTEGVQLMVEGEKRRFWIPASLAYEGRRGPQGTLVFDVELVRIVD